MASDNWFEDAKEEVEASPRAKYVRNVRSTSPALTPVQRLARAGMSGADLAAAAEALKAFGAVAAGTAPVHAAGPTPVYTWGGPKVGPNTPAQWERVERSLTPEEGLAAIVKAVRDAEDPMKEAGKWITLVTNGILEVTKEQEGEE